MIFETWPVKVPGKVPTWPVKKLSQIRKDLGHSQVPLFICLSLREVNYTELYAVIHLDQRRYGMEFHILTSFITLNAVFTRALIEERIIPCHVFFATPKKTVST